MIKLNHQKNSGILAGDRAARIRRQAAKCKAGSRRACRRAARMIVRSMR